MMRALCSLARLQELAGASSLSAPSVLRAFSVKPTPDYALVMKQATEVGKHEPFSKGNAALIAGHPEETFKRKVRIYVPSRSPSQSGYAKTNHTSTTAPVWKIEFDTQQKWQNPLIGWTSTADPLENVGRASLFFYSKEEAISFADKHGFEYAVDEPNPRNFVRQKRYASYPDNFSTLKRRGLPDLSTMRSNQPATAE